MTEEFELLKWFEMLLYWNFHLARAAHGFVSPHSPVPKMELVSPACYGLFETPGSSSERGNNAQLVILGLFYFDTNDLNNSIYECP